MDKECKFCKEKNNANARKCSACGAPFASKAASGTPTISFIRLSDKKVVKIPEGGAVLGRNCGIAPEVFNHEYVSESHCRVTVDNNCCCIEDVGSGGNGSTNGTFINGSQLPKRTPTRFDDGDSLRIAHMVFDIKIEYPQAAPEPAIRLVWAIDCPVCDKRYVVKDGNVRISECDRCVDIMDRQEISNVRPKQVQQAAP